MFVKVLANTIAVEDLVDKMLLLRVNNNLPTQFRCNRSVVLLSQPGHRLLLLLQRPDYAGLQSSPLRILLLIPKLLLFLISKLKRAFGQNCSMLLWRKALEVVLDVAVGVHVADGGGRVLAQELAGEVLGGTDKST